MLSPREFMTNTVTRASSIGFVPVAVHFGIFELLVKLDREVSAADVVEETAKNAKFGTTLNLPLAEDVLFIMAGAGFLDQLEGEKYVANSTTRHLVANPSSIQGLLWFSIEALMGAAFVYPKLLDTNFAYPFKDNAAAFQYAYEKMGNSKFAQQHMYTTMHDQDRMESFNAYMDGKFGLSRKMPERVGSLGYDLDAVLHLHENPVIVDIGGGRGQMLLEIQEAYPHLTAANLILQEFSADIEASPAVTTMVWDFKSAAPQPVVGATVYSLKHIFHNMPDLEAVQLMQKLARAMGGESRIWIHEVSKTPVNGNLHAAMIACMGGRERSSREWAAMAGLCGLRVSFEAYVDLGEGLVEMRLI